MSEKDYTRENEVVMDRWRRDEDRKRSTAEHAEKVTRDTIAKLLKQDGFRSNVAKDLKKAVTNPSNLPFKEGFGGTDPLETGFNPDYLKD